MIGLLNGRVFDWEIVPTRGITIAADDATIFDVHDDIVTVSWYGIQNAFQEPLGVKRAPMCCSTGGHHRGESIEWGTAQRDARGDQLVKRAHVIAYHIMSQPRNDPEGSPRRSSVGWNKCIVDDLDAASGFYVCDW